MGQGAQLERLGDFARIRAPAGRADAEALCAALSDAAGQPGLKAILIEAWPEEATAPGLLRQLAAQIAEAAVPVIALLDGPAGASVLAPALAADMRVARPGLRIVLPELGLGTLPPAGLAVRMARRLGPIVTAEILSGGGPLTAQAAVQLGLCELVSAAGIPDLPQSLAPAAAQDAARYLAEISALRGQIPSGPMAAVRERLADVLEAALLLPVEEAITYSEVAREDLDATELAGALHHVARARERAALLAGVAEPEQLPGRVALWNQPEKLARALLRGGVRVTLGESDPARLETVVRDLAAAQERAVAAGRITPEAAAGHWAGLSPAVSLEELAGSGLRIVAARPEEAEALRQQDPGALALEDAPARPGEARFSRLPGLVEVAGEPAVLALLAPALRAGRDLVLHAQGLGHWLEVAYIVAAERTLMAGATPDAVDAALTAWGFAEGPFARLDRRGLEAILPRIAGTPWHAGAYLNLLLLEGRLGAEVGAGVRQYGPNAAPWPGEAEELAALRAEAGITARPLPAAEITARVLAELAQAGALALQAGRAHRAGDVDLVAIAALGLARHRGGPMFQADRMGLLPLRNRLRALAAEGAPAPAPLLDVLIRNGRCFAELDA